MSTQMFNWLRRLFWAFEISHFHLDMQRASNFGVKLQKMPKWFRTAVRKKFIVIWSKPQLECQTFHLCTVQTNGCNARIGLLLMHIFCSICMIVNELDCIALHRTARCTINLSTAYNLKWILTCKLSIWIRVFPFAADISPLVHIISALSFSFSLLVILLYD